MKSRLDCLAFEALDAERHLTRVSNAAYMERLRNTVWPQLTTEQQELYGKLLASDRSRFVANDDLGSLAADTHESRYSHYKSHLERLALLCVDALMARADVPGEKVRLIITNHTVGGVCPPLSSLVAHHLGLPASVQALDLAYMGCSAAIWGAELAARLLAPGEVALILSAELTSVMTNPCGAPESLVANCVFGDGIGAFLVCAPPHPYRTLFRIHDFGGSLIASDQGLDCIRYEPNPVYHEIRLKDTIPAVANQGIEAVLRTLVARNLVTLPQKLRYLVNKRVPRWQNRVDYFVLHTAGNKILQGIQEHLRLSDRQIAHNFRCFNTYGNTSSASIYYSLRELEKSAPLRKGDRLLFLAYGSGFMTKGMYATVA